MKLPQVDKRIEYIDLSGGLDLVTPRLNRKPGRPTVMQNFECDLNGGYATIKGYEAFDGQPRPSSATYSILGVRDIGSVSLGDTITGQVSSASGVIISATDISFVLTRVSGTFLAGETLLVGGVSKGTVSGSIVPAGADTNLLHATYKNLAADLYRTDISAVPGSGPVRGVWNYKSTVYAFRDNAAGASVDMYRATSAGWELVTLYSELYFTGGFYGPIPEQGDTIRDTVTGATAIVVKTITTSGSIAGSDLAGYFIIKDQSGSFGATNTIDTAYEFAATCTANSSEIAFSNPGGRFEFINANFGGAVSSLRMYGVDGKNRGFEFDGSILVPINTGMAADTPKHLVFHQFFLFFSFSGSVQHSSLGDPYTWDPLFGAGEIGLGDEVTGFMQQPGNEASGALVIYTRNTTNVLYGTGTDSWSLVSYKADFGGVAGSMQMVGQSLAFDDNGITSLATSTKYGNFTDATLTAIVQPIVPTLRGMDVFSSIHRAKNQYRLFFRNGQSLYTTIANGKVVGISVISLPNRVSCICSTETESGAEETFFGSDDGFVYQLDSGTSFNGEPIESYFWTGDVFCKAPYATKRWRRAIIEAVCDGYSEVEFSYRVKTPGDQSQPASKTTDVSREILLPGDLDNDEFLADNAVLSSVGSVVSWDAGATWDSYRWDDYNKEPLDIALDGTSVNVALGIKVSSDKFDPITFTGIILQYSPMRYRR